MHNVPPNLIHVQNYMNIGSFPFISCTVKATLSSASSTSRVVVTTAKRGWALKEVKKRTMQSRQYLGLVLKQVRRQELCQYCNCNTNSNPCSHHLSFPQTGDNSEIGHVIIHIVCLAMTFVGLQGDDCSACHKVKENQHETKTKGLFYQGDAVIARISGHVLPMQLRTRVVHHATFPFSYQ